MKLIHDIYSMSVGRYGELLDSNNQDLFKTKWNPLPVVWFNLEKIIKTFSDALNNGVNKEFIVEIGRLIMINKIQQLETLYLGIRNLILVKPDNDQWKVTTKGKTNLNYYIELVKELTGIIIKDLIGLDRLGKEIDRLNNKFLERYGKKKPKKGEAIPFTRYAKSVYLLLDTPYDPDMSFYEFLQDTILADQKAKELEKLKLKHGARR